MKIYQYAHFYGVFFAFTIGMSLGCPSQVYVYAAHQAAAENCDDAHEEQLDLHPQENKTEEILIQKGNAPLRASESFNANSSPKIVTEIFGHTADTEEGSDESPAEETEVGEEDSETEEVEEDSETEEETDMPFEPPSEELNCGVMDQEEFAEALALEAQRQRALLGDGGGAGTGDERITWGRGAHRIMTLLVEVGESQFDEDNLANLPALIYGAEVDTENPPAYSVNDMYEKDSYGQASIVGTDGEPGGEDDIFGPFHVDTYDCAHPGDTLQEVVSQNENDLDIAPFAEDVRFLVIVRKNGPACTYGGIAGSVTLTSDDLPEGTKRRSVAFSLSATNPLIMAHELGHVLGMGHAGLGHCSGADWQRFPFAENRSAYYGDETCGSRVYADPFGFMGNVGPNAITHSSAVAKEAWGWLQSHEEAPHRILQVTESGRYSLNSLSEENESGLKALKVIHGKHKWIYVEYRRARNDDGSLTADHAFLEAPRYEDNNFFAGALLHMGRPNFLWQPTSFLFDAFITEDDMPLWESGHLRNFNYALPFGESYVDPMTDTRINLGISNLTGTVDVDIEMGRTDFEAPEILAFHIDKNESSGCELVLRGEVFDPSDISELVLTLYKNILMFDDDEYLEIELEPRNGDFVYRGVDMLRFSGGQAGLRIRDNAQAQGGLAPNNLLDNGPETWNQPFQIHFPAGGDGLPCDNQGPRITLAEPLRFQSHWPTIVTNPVHIDFNITDESQLNFATITYSPEPFNGNPPVMLFTFFALGENTNTVTERLTANIPPGFYKLRIVTEDAHQNQSDLDRFFTVTDQRPFIRGDANQDGTLDIADISHITNVLYQGIGSFTCLDAADTNDDGRIDISDVQTLSGFLFSGTESSLPEPFQNAGNDPTEDDLNCSGYVE